MKNKYILGIDTSNYKTSVAVTDDKNNIICDQRVFLKVKQGEKGLRQSDALFQHIRNMPYLINEAMKAIAGHLAAVSFSDRPRPVEGSYMPVFLAGESFGKTIAASLDIPYISFSHQEGHIEAVKAFSAHKDKDRLLACHFSGGTCEVLSIREKNGRYEIKIVGGSKDISFGQVIDRAGVKLGMSFPAGEEMDITAVEASYATDLLTPVKVREGKINLSGIDTQFQRLADNLKYEDRDHLIRELMEKIADAMS